MARGFDWLNGMIYGLRAVVDESTELTTTDTIRFTGAGVSASYDEGNGWISVSIPGVDASLSWTSVATVAASATSPLVIGGSQWLSAHHVRTGATPATTTGQLRVTDGEIIAAKIDGTDEVVLKTDGSTIQIGDDFGPIIERPADASNWYVEDGTGVRLLASSTAVGVNRRLFLYGGTATTATAKGHVGLDSTGRLTVYADGSEKTCLVTGDAGGGSLSTGCDIDYATIGGTSPQDFKAGGDGNYTIAAKTHAVLNSANAAKLELDANGLTGRDSANTNWPVIHLPLSTLAPAVSLARHEAWILARLKLSAGTPGGGTFLRMALDFEAWVAANTANRYMYQQAGYQGGAHYLAIGAAGTVGGEFAVSSPLITDDQVVAWQIANGGRLVNFYSMAWGGSWPSPDDFSQDATTLLTHSSYAWTPSSATLRLAWNDTTGSTAEWSLPRIQVLYR